MKIGVFTDAHYCGRERIEDYRPRLSLKKVNEMLADFKNQGVELVICLGDLLNLEASEAQNEENLRIISKPLRESGIRCLLIPGNHDAEIFSREKYAELSGIELAPLAVDCGDTRLILLDAGYYDTGVRHAPPETDWTNSYVPPQELQWFKEQLADSSKRCIVFTHQCLDFGVECHHLIRNAVHINSIICDSGNVSHVYSGHYHWGAESSLNGIAYSTLPAMFLGERNYYLTIEV